MGKQSSIDQLNSFLRGELSAVETYRMALEKLDEKSDARSDLELNLTSHQDRVALLRNAIVLCGGEPAESSGPWGVFAKTIESGARLFGDKASIAALEEGEDHGLKDYKKDSDELAAEPRRLMNTRLLPLQQQSHDRMSALKHRLAKS
ncbi:MAG: DUF2383 domain-containing protein [Kofleriaceae bacterium]